MAKFNAAAPDHFPMEEVLRQTTLDKSQAEALKAALTQEVALIQGPPGTGAIACLFYIYRDQTFDTNRKDLRRDTDRSCTPDL